MINGGFRFYLWSVRDDHVGLRGSGGQGLWRVRGGRVKKDARAVLNTRGRGPFQPNTKPFISRLGLCDAHS